MTETIIFENEDWVVLPWIMRRKDGRYYIYAQDLVVSALTVEHDPDTADFSWVAQIGGKATHRLLPFMDAYLAAIERLIDPAELRPDWRDVLLSHFEEQLVARAVNDLAGRLLPVRDDDECFVGAGEDAAAHDRARELLSKKPRETVIAMGLVIDAGIGLDNAA